MTPPSSTAFKPGRMPRRVLGIDPGLRLTGYAVLEISQVAGGATRRGRAGSEASLIEAGVIRLAQGRTVARRLAELDADLRDIIERTSPHVGAVEKLYAHYKHPLTGVIMGHARGVVLLNIQRAGMDLVELGATEVKKSLTGNGHASKAQMQSGVQSQLNMPAPLGPADVADAIAIALCCLRRLG